jgi:hypothetical protein
MVKKGLWLWGGLFLDDLVDLSILALYSWFIEASMSQDDKGGSTNEPEQGAEGRSEE